MTVYISVNCTNNHKHVFQNKNSPRLAGAAAAAVDESGSCVDVAGAGDGVAAGDEAGGANGGDDGGERATSMSKTWVGMGGGNNAGVCVLGAGILLTDVGSACGPSANVHSVLIVASLAPFAPSAFALVAILYVSLLSTEWSHNA